MSSNVLKKCLFFFFSSRRRHTRCSRDWSSDVCSSDLRTLMPLYEHVFLARQDASTQQVEELTTQMTGIVEQAGGKVTKTENWGVRSLKIGRASCRERV